MDHHNKVIQTSVPFEGPAMLDVSKDRGDLKLTIETSYTVNSSNPRKDKLVDFPRNTANTKTKVLQGIVETLAKIPEDHRDHDSMIFYPKQPSAIDFPIVSSEAINTSAYASEVNHDANICIADGYLTQGDAESSRLSKKCPLMPKLLFSEGSEGNKDRFVPAFGPRRSFLPALELVSLQEDDSDFDPAFDEQQPENLCYNFDPFAQQSHSPVLPEVPSSLAAFYFNYSRGLHRPSNPRGAGVSSPTSVLEMQDGSMNAPEQSML
ncbi:hypothetical protein FisN_2Hh455 [Fistulifera solaris]|uniref:Uncharacterized protein n=1 Tax=Fistulifera solaris TaxID=1519565 RepID=A0A1Z5JGF0_FISSO|nr:hypothetical protein FisN_2Hh455 [Fistulifera solaris]|eukprot:GAX12962.1 hypothetical protein FisN_2Hh455 [Fistulifera solaris]